MCLDTNHNFQVILVTETILNKTTLVPNLGKENITEITKKFIKVCTNCGLVEAIR